MTRVLRLVAFAIAVAGVVDPAITMSGASRPRVAVIALRSAASDDARVHDRLVRELAGSFEVVSNMTSDAAAAVLIGDRIPDDAMPDRLRIATVTMPPDVGPGLKIVDVDAPRQIPPATVIRLDVLLEARGLSGQTSDVTAAIADLQVGSASHRWTVNDERWRARIDVVPVGEPPYAIRIRLPPSPTGGSGATGNPDSTETGGAAPPVRLKPDTTEFGEARTVADVVVDVRRTPFRVEFYDPRPSWATTFIRRALEADRRFQVTTISSTSRGVSVQTPGAVPLADPRLDAFDVLVVGALERLSASEARSLERFMRERGGAVVTVPDQRVDTAPGRDLLAEPDLVERLLERPATLEVVSPAASLRASELLIARATAPGTDVIARIPGGEGGPVVVSTPRGDGRLLFSGAMDAWRFRAADNGAFDRFWQSTIAGIALQVPPPTAVRVDPQIVRPGQRAAVVARVRSRQPGRLSASADGEPIRLLPGPEIGTYRGDFVAGAVGRSIIETRTAGGERAEATILVQADAEPARAANAPTLALLSSSHRGIDVTPEHLADLERFLRETVAAPRAELVHHPMRSTWWIVPFVVCLSAEWWLRRRRGLL
jgi:hypothetical protein